MVFFCNVVGSIWQFGCFMFCVFEDYLNVVVFVFFSYCFNYLWFCLQFDIYIKFFFLLVFDKFVNVYFIDCVYCVGVNFECYLFIFFRNEEMFGVQVGQKMVFGFFVRERN